MNDNVNTAHMPQATPQPALRPGEVPGRVRRTTHQPKPASEQDRPLKPALARGWRRRCPNCGTGPMMKGYLKVHDSCTVCGEELYHHRADDGPAYLTILVVGHLLAPVLHIVWVNFRPEPMVMASFLTIVMVALSLYLLPRFKGFLVAFQWAKRMHGFAADEELPQPENV